jgi:hypothetical protein
MNEGMPKCPFTLGKIQLPTETKSEMNTEINEANKSACFDGRFAAYAHFALQSEGTSPQLIR